MFLLKEIKSNESETVGKNKQAESILDKLLSFKIIKTQTITTANIKTRELRTE